ncbi:unnamed protein product, partial [Mesorhabditis belari]|uniref:Mitogen-activated protein kinase kinase kinase n=1 Tax=Mesorhabditis belari TaxID=2138241 RepID=A0AAF3J289_9BILA
MAGQNIQPPVPLRQQQESGYGSTNDNTSTMNSTMNRARENLPKVNPLQLSVHFQNLLGSGTFGKVVRGLHAEYGDVAIKIAEDDKGKKKDLLKECSMLYKYGANHPNIVKWYGLYESAHLLGFVMEFMDCGTLDNLLLRENHLDYKIDHVFAWMHQASDAVCYMHSVGLVHRDLKPLNLLLRDGYLHLKLCDFGTVIDIRRTMTNCVGSAAYMAPEVFQGRSYGPACDVYSMAIILWQMIARRSPYGRVEKITLLWNVHQGHRPQDLKCHWILRTFVQKCWAHKPEDRPNMESVLEFSKIMCKVYPHGHEPLKDKHFLSADPQRVGQRKERLSTGRVQGHRRTRSDEVTLVNTNTPASTPSTTNEMTSSVVENSHFTPRDAGALVSRSSTNTPTMNHNTSSPSVSNAEELLARIPANLKPPSQILDDESSEQSYNEHLAMCREWLDYSNILQEATAQKHQRLFEVTKRLELKKKIAKRDHLKAVYDQAINKLNGIEESFL